MSHHHTTPVRRCCTPAARRRHRQRLAVAPRRLRLDCATTHPQRVAGNNNAFPVPRIGFSSPPPAAPLKRPRYDHDDALHTRMRGTHDEIPIRSIAALGFSSSAQRSVAGLEISCETTDMEEEQERVGGLPAGAAASGLRPPPSRRCAGAVCRHWRSCAFPVYPADAASVLLSAAAGAVRCYSAFARPSASDSPGRGCPPHSPRAVVAAPPRRAPPSFAPAWCPTSQSVWLAVEEEE